MAHKTEKIYYLTIYLKKKKKDDSKRVPVFLIISHWDAVHDHFKVFTAYPNAVWASEAWDGGGEGACIEKGPSVCAKIRSVTL